MGDNPERSMLIGGNQLQSTGIKTNRSLTGTINEFSLIGRRSKKMKKLIGIGIAAMMVMGLAISANATLAAWTLNLRAGVLVGTTWNNSAALGAIGIATAAATRTYTTVAATTAGFLNTDGTTGLLCAKDIRAAGQQTYTWKMQLDTGANYPAGVTTTIGYWSSAVATDWTGWTIQAWRVDAPTVKYDILAGGKAGVYGVAAINNLTTAEGLPTSLAQDWIVQASVPEPGSMVAMFSGLVGLVGFSVRRRK